MKISKFVSIYDAPPGCIRTFSGLYVDVFNPKPYMFRIEDIAHALSQQCRFGGHLREPLSVAQHSYLVSLKVEEPQNFLGALLHDAAEAYLLDIPTPIKHKLPDYMKLEDNLMKVIGDTFKFEYPLNFDIKQADKFMLEMEWEALMFDDSKVKFDVWTPEEAEYKFLIRFNEVK